jgi:cobalt-zinc-cadmium efflux system membrane fusion protein
MTTSPASRPDRVAGWRDAARRRWPWIVGALVVLVLALWALRRRGSEATEARPAAADSTAEKAANDSVVALDSAALRMAGIRTMDITATSAGALVVNGTITYDANRVSVLSSRAEGRIAAVRADLGQSVFAGQVLALIESQDVGQTRGDLERARANVDVARKNYEREERLFREQISPQKELLEAEAALRTAEADFNSARSRLQAVGASGGQGATFGLASPIAGTVVERNASPGQVAGPSASLFTVADLRHVWITADVYEGDLPRVRQGAPAVVVPTALPNETFPGRVTYAGGIVDPATRAFKVRVEVENQGQRLRPGMFAQVRIQTAAGDDRGSTSIVVPEVAVQDVNGKPVVFVALQTPGRFVARPVTVGPRAGNSSVVVTQGLRPGDRVVTQGAFQLKSELTKASFAGED